MPLLIDGCWAKIERAKENIKKLDAETETLLRSPKSPYRVVGQLKLEDRKYVYTAFGPPVPLRFSVLAGEIAHHLRSVLDHLVYALVIDEDRVLPSKNHQFPVCETVGQFDGACKNGRIRGISRPARELIRSVQPYRQKNPATDTLLGLHRLNIVDKHKLLAVVTSVVQMGDKIEIGSDSGELVITGMSPPPGLPEPTIDGTEVFCIDFATVYPDTKVNIEFAKHVVFEELADTKQVPVTEALSKMASVVTRTIKLFESEL